MHVTHRFFSVYISGVCTPSLPLGKVQCCSLLGSWGQPHRVRNLGSISLSPLRSVILGRLSSDFSGLTWNSYNFRSWGNDTAQSDGAGAGACTRQPPLPSVGWIHTTGNNGWTHSPPGGHFCLCHPSRPNLTGDWMTSIVGFLANVPNWCVGSSF